MPPNQSKPSDLPAEMSTPDLIAGTERLAVDEQAATVLFERAREQLAQIGSWEPGYRAGSRDIVWTTLVAVCEQIQTLPVRFDPAMSVRHPLRLDDPADGQQPKQSTGALDICMAAAATLEKFGLYPVIARCQHKLLLGCWLTPLRAPNPKMADPAQIRRLAGSGQMVLVDPCSLFASPPQSVQQAADSAAQLLSQDADNTVQLIDLARRGDLTPQADDTVIRTRANPDEDNEQEQDFVPPVPDHAALASLAVALNIPRSQADYARLEQLDSLRAVSAATTQRQWHYLLAADANQRMVVKAAPGQESFCLIAPAGTGGVQTSVNLMSQLLADGQSVLHISSSTSLHNTVCRHMRTAGIAELFGLPVGEDPGDTTAKPVGVVAPPAPVGEARKQLAAIQQQRLTYAAAMSGSTQSDWTLHSTLSLCVTGRSEWEETVEWHLLDPEQLPHPTQLNQIVRELLEQQDDLLRPAGDDLQVIGNANWSERWETELLECTAGLKRSSEELGEQAERFVEFLGADIRPNARSHYDSLGTVAALLPKTDAAAAKLIANGMFEKLRAALVKAMGMTDEYDNLRRSLSCEYRPDAELELPIDDLSVKHQALLHSHWPLRNIRSNQLRSALGRFAKGKPDPANDIPLLGQMHALRKKIDDIKLLPQHFEAQWMGINSDFLTISEQLEQAENLLAPLRALRTAGPVDELAGQIQLLLAQSNDSDGERTSPSAAEKGYLKALEEHHAFYKRFIELAAPNRRITGGSGQTWPQFTATLAAGVLDRRWDIRDWCGWRRRHRETSQGNLGMLIDSLQAAGVTPTKIGSALHYACARSWLEHYLTHKNETALDQWAEPMQMQQTHRQASDAYRAALAADLVSARANSDTNALATTLTDYLARPDFGERRFDVVIFGDADRVTLADAIQIIAYAGRAIFVGDPMRPEPTAPDPLHEGLERGIANQGVMRAALALGIAARQLRQDYAGRNAELVAWTNRIGPQVSVRPLVPANTLQLGLQLTQVEDGVYGGGDVRDNPSEASRVVSELISLAQEYAALPERSWPRISVVTMTAAQRDRIAALLATESQSNVGLRRFLDPDRTDAVSVRTAQEPGRLDAHVLFSTTVARSGNLAGSLPLDPFEGTSGMRRLYNLLSHTSQRLHIVTSLGPEDLEDSSTPSPPTAQSTDPSAQEPPPSENQPDPALQMLHRLMAAAANPYDNDGQSDVDNAAAPAPVNAFDQMVHDTVTTHGLQVAVPTETYGAGIDLIVENPAQPGAALAAIVTDSACFAQPKSDVVRRDDCNERALLNAGWQLIQSSPMQWWRDEAIARQALLAQLDRLSTMARPVSDALSSKAGAQTVDQRFERLTIVDVPYCDPDALLEDDYNDILRQLVRAVVAREGPIREDYLVRRIAALHQRHNVESDLAPRIAAITSDYPTTEDDGHRFLWDESVDIAAIHYRPAVSHRDKRQLAEFAPQELAAAAAQFGIGADKSDGARQLARAIGLVFPTNEALRARLRQAIADAGALVEKTP